ncbi:MAG: DUF2157 domain-containing protein [Synechococcales cyanobacterium M58_A2018_015]|nr:DUF2157 domain-containing protein [Synechococcales cyanobacterium M58_A2018_015]
MMSDQFRRQLRHEVEQWRSEGLIDATQYQQLAERYQFATLETQSRDRFIVVVISLGSILLGLSAITFVAANWQAISREVKVLLAMVLFVGINGLGFHLWSRASQEPDRQTWQQRLGQGLLLLGALMLGANLTLMGQLFHHSGSGAELCLVWGLAVLIMAYSLQLTSLGVLAMSLVGLGYWYGIQELSGAGVLPGLQWMIQFMPLVAVGLFMPLAYWCRSRTIFTLGAIAVISSLQVVLGDAYGLFIDAPGIVLVLSFVLPPALLWSYEEWWRSLRALNQSKPNAAQNLAQTPESLEGSESAFPPLARSLALVWVTVLLYILSFHGTWQEPPNRLPLLAQLQFWLTTGTSLILNPNVLLLTGLTVGQWFYLLRPAYPGNCRRLSSDDREMLLRLFIIAGITFWHWSLTPIQVFATVVGNVLLFLLAVKFIREGLAEGQRSLFWSGTVLLALQILSRLLEYDTGLLLKSLVFLLCGIGIIGMGLWFEHHLRTLKRP